MLVISFASSCSFHHFYTKYFGGFRHISDLIYSQIISKVKTLNVNTFYRNKTTKNISKFTTKTSSTLFTQKPNLNLTVKKSLLTNKKSNEFGLKSTCVTFNEIFVANGIRAFHNSAIVNFKAPNFIKNIFSRNNGPSISASTTSPSSDSENGSKAINLWISFVSLFSDSLADKIAYNRINKKRINVWRYEVAEAEQSDNRPNSNENLNSNNNNNNNNVNNYNSEIINNNADNNNNLNKVNINNNNNNYNNNNYHNNFISDSNDKGGDLSD